MIELRYFNIRKVSFEINKEKQQIKIYRSYLFKGKRIFPLFQIFGIHCINALLHVCMDARLITKTPIHKDIPS